MNLENKIPPPIVALVIGILISSSSAFVTPFSLYGNKVIAIIIMASSFLIIILSIKKFKNQKTTTNPMHPNKTVKLITTGVFSLSRNPMYVGLAGVLVGTTLFLEAWFGLIALPLFIIYINKYQIKPEENILHKKFKDEYVVYCTQVKRWI